MQGILILVGICVVLAVISYLIIKAYLRKGTDERLKANGFVLTRSAGSLRVDDKNKKWYINDLMSNEKIYDFADVSDCKIDENSVLNKVNKLGVYIYTKKGGAIYISIINTEMKRDSFSYKSLWDTANQIYSIVQSMIVRSSEKSLDLPAASTNSSPDIGEVEEQLKKLKGMVDSGLITQEDFEAKKKQLLGL